MKRVVKRNVEAEMTLKEAFKEFCTMKDAQGRASATLKNYETTFKIFCDFFKVDDDTACESITESNIYKWIGTMRTQDYPTTTINHYLRDTRTFLYYCMDRDYITIPFKITLVKGQEEKIKAFEEDDIEKLLERPRKKDDFTTWRTWAIVNYIYATGNRSATVCNLRINDIDFKRKEISISATKNKRNQVIPLSSALETVLKEFIKMWRNGVDKDEFLFCNISGEQMTTNASRQAFERYCDARDVKQHNLHGLRHSFAKGAIKAGMNVYTLQNVLGHSSLDMTKKYVRLYSEDLKEGYDDYSPLDQMKKKQSRRKGVSRND